METRDSDENRNEYWTNRISQMTIPSEIFHRFNFCAHFYSPLEILRIYKALELAEQWHTGQLRDEGSPYIYHPVLTAVLAMEKQASPDEVCASLLHDCLEDNPSVSTNDLEREMGPLITELVRLVSKEVEGQKIDREEYFRQISSNPSAVRLKGWDRISNLFSLLKMPRADKQEWYLKTSRRDILPLLQKVDPKLAEEMEELLCYLEEQLGF